MSITASSLEQRLQTSLQPFHLEVLDESVDHIGHAGSNGKGHGTHFRVRIGAAIFTGKNRVTQHRLVYDALRDFMALGLHALAIEIVQNPTSN